MLKSQTLPLSEPKLAMSVSDTSSPTKPVGDAAEPEEDARSKAGSEMDMSESLPEPVSPLTVSSMAPSNTGDPGDAADLGAVVLTESVIAEESKMEKQEQREDEKEEEELQKRKELWRHMDNETREMRYERLQNLLMKSNMYTEYLLQRMDRQKEEEQKRRELEAKKEKRQKQKEAAAKPTEAKSTDEPTPPNQEGKKPEPKVADQTSSPASSQGRRRMSLRAPLPRSQLSTPNSQTQTPQSQTSQPSTPVVGDSGDKAGLDSQPATPRVDGAGDEEEGEDPLGSPQSDKENKHGLRRSARGRKSAATEQEGDTPKRGKKRKTAEAPQQAKLTNFFVPPGKKRKTETEKEKSTETEETEKSKTKKKRLEPLPYGQSIKDEEGKVVKPYLLSGGDLRPYQVDGLNWLRILFENGVNGILADEMGLGKTVQCIAALAEFIVMGCQGPFIVVAPLSTLPNWKSEFTRFAPQIPTVFYHGNKDDRAHLRRKMHRSHEVMSGVHVKPVVLTSYEIAMRDRPFLKDFLWSYMIVDEGHRIKNNNCRLIRELKQYSNAHRLLLTGTPLQNNLSELWSLLNFLLPEIFDDLGSFETWFDVEVISDQDADEAIIREEKKTNILGMLHQILTPFMLRRVKSDVDLQIPPKKEILVYAPMVASQKVFYEATVDRTILQKLQEKNKEEVEEVEDVELTSCGRPKRFAARKSVDYKAMISDEANPGEEDSDVESWVQAMIDNSKPTERQEKKKTSIIRVRLQNIMMQLRKVVNHPYLLEYPLTSAGEYKIDEELVRKCGKMMLLDKMLTELKTRGHKVLLFSQMTRMMDIIEDLLWLRGYKYRRLDGSTAVEDRREAMDAFNQDEEVFVFLLSTRAGGLGINLVGGDTVIIYDSDWNPQNDLQAQDRCHRIGQTRPVMVYRLVTANTIDQKIVERAAAKRKLEKMVIKKGKFKSGISNFSRELKPINPEELMQLLKSRDYSSVVGEKESSVISKKDLDVLLDRSDMIADYEKIKQGLKVQTEEKEDTNVLRTSGKESCKLFKTVDYDAGENTLASKDPTGECSQGSTDSTGETTQSQTPVETKAD